MLNIFSAKDKIMVNLAYIAKVMTFPCMICDNEYLALQSVPGNLNLRLMFPSFLCFLVCMKQHMKQ